MNQYSQLMLLLRDYAYLSKKRNGLNLFDYIKNELARHDISLEEFNTILHRLTWRSLFLRLLFLVLKLQNQLNPKFAHTILLLGVFLLIFSPYYHN